MRRALAPLRELDDFLRNLTLRLAGDLKLNFDGSQDLARLSGDGVGALRHDVFMFQIGQRFPKNVLQAASREGTNDGYGAAPDRLHAYAVALCYGYLLRI